VVFAFVPFEKISIKHCKGIKNEWIKKKKKKYQTPLQQNKSLKNSKLK